MLFCCLPWSVMMSDQGVPPAAVIWPGELVPAAGPATSLYDPSWLIIIAVAVAIVVIAGIAGICIAQTRRRLRQEIAARQITEQRLAEVQEQVAILDERRSLKLAREKQVAKIATELKSAILPILDRQDQPRIAPHDPAQDDARMALGSQGNPARPGSAVIAQDLPQDQPAVLRPKKAIILPRYEVDEASLCDVRDWVQSWLDSGQTGSRTLYGDAYDHYANWCRARRRKPVPKSAFTLAMKELGWPKKEPGAVNYRAKVGGKVWFYGAAIRKQPRLESAAL
jgi:hypothetical protein